MSDTATLLNAFRANDFEEAKRLLTNDEDLSSALQDHQRSSVFEKILNEKAFEIVPILIDQQIIPTDLYDYKSFNGSIFQSIFFYLKDDEESVAFLDDFLSKIEDINEEVQAITLLDYAMEKNAPLSFIQSMINAGANLNQVNNSEYTYLHRIVKNNTIKPERAALYLDLLLQEGLDVNALDVVGQSPLILSITNNKPALTEVLLQNGAAVNHQDKSGNSAFYYAVVHKRSAALYENLKNYGHPELNHLNNDRTTILFELIRGLHKPSPDELKFMKQLIEDGADPLQPSIWYEKEKMPLDMAVEKPFEVLSAILKTDQVEIDNVYEDGNTLLHKVCAFNVNYDSDMARDTYKKAKLLIEMGIDPNLNNSKDETALMLALNDNLKSKTVALLLSHQKS